MIVFAGPFDMHLLVLSSRSENLSSPSCTLDIGGDQKALYAASLKCHCSADLTNVTLLAKRAERARVVSRPAGGSTLLSPGKDRAVHMIRSEHLATL